MEIHWVWLVGSPTFLKWKWDCSNRNNYTRIIVISPHVNPTHSKMSFKKESGNSGFIADSPQDYPIAVLTFEM